MAEFRTCPACGYERGFHVFFSTPDEVGGPTSIGLICPSCGRSYDLGWQTREVAVADGRPGPVFGDRG